MSSKRAPEWVTDETRISAMLDDPIIPVLRDDYPTEIDDHGEKVILDCRFYWTPQPEEHRHPGPAPVAPVEPIPPAQIASAGQVWETRLAAKANAVFSRNQAFARRLKAHKAWIHSMKKFESRQAAHTALIQAHNHALSALRLDFSPNGTGPPPAPSHPQPDIIFTHGRHTENHRASTFRSLQNIYPTNTFAGRSMGARTCARAALYNAHITKLIFFTIPLMRGLEELFDEVLALPAEVDVLFVVGDADDRCPEIVMHGVRKRMRARSWLIRVVRGDHALWYMPEERRVKICEVAGQLAAEWNRDDGVGGGRDPEKTEMVLDWEGDDYNGRPRWTEWMRIVD
ncbi:hypothetical protein EG329_002935 [Mollisiaceae sp. DMI_Dod_QoI]|nr:hypothetical protein EG329_002935 [Helotiales sp. DMI_Dod_QoI]